MSYDYDRFISLAKRLIDKFGRNVTRNTLTNSGLPFDPTTTKESFVIKAVATDGKVQEQAGGLVESCDKIFISYDEILADDTIVDGSNTYSIVKVTVVQTGTPKIIYKAMAVL